MNSKPFILGENADFSEENCDFLQTSSQVSQYENYTNAFRQIEIVNMSSSIWKFHFIYNCTFIGFVLS